MHACKVHAAHNRISIAEYEKVLLSALFVLRVHSKQQDNEIPTCAVHIQQEMDLYCAKCQKLICHFCAISMFFAFLFFFLVSHSQCVDEHQLHHVISVQEQFEILRQHLRDSLKPVEDSERGISSRSFVTD
jgi:hypothetical protein